MLVPIQFLYSYFSQILYHYQNFFQVWYFRFYSLRKKESEREKWERERERVKGRDRKGMREGEREREEGGYGKQSRRSQSLGVHYKTKLIFHNNICCETKQISFPSFVTKMLNLKRNKISFLNYTFLLVGL